MFPLEYRNLIRSSFMTLLVGFSHRMSLKNKNTKKKMPVVIFVLNLLEAAGNDCTLTLSLQRQTI